MRQSNAKAIWEGGLKAGTGSFEAGSQAFKGPYSFATRFGEAKGTNPEELIAAAHAACFSMALSGGLERAGTPPTRITTTATCTMDTVNNKATITEIRLETRGKVSGIDQAAFAKAADDAKAGCPVSRALSRDIQVEVQATLEQ